MAQEGRTEGKLKAEPNVAGAVFFDPGIVIPIRLKGARETIDELSRIVELMEKLERFAIFKARSYKSGAEMIQRMTANPLP